MLKKTQIEAIVRFADRPREWGAIKRLASDLGVTEGSLRVHLHNYRRGRAPPSWRRALGEKP